MARIATPSRIGARHLQANCTGGKHHQAANCLPTVRCLSDDPRHLIELSIVHDLAPVAGKIDLRSVVPSVRELRRGAHPPKEGFMATWPGGETAQASQLGRFVLQFTETMGVVWAAGYLGG